ncbi:MAG: hypothetical protein DRI36_03830 [Caldiserica bacterium]|nr:MAG: hypothetical protein DRI36_03830 [Caldisericota bacterium]
MKAYSTGIFFNKPIIDVLKVFKKDGVDLIEIWTGKGRGDKEEHFKYQIKDEVERVSEFIELNGLNIFSVHAPYSDRICLTNKDYQEEAVKEIKIAINIAKMVKAEYVLIHPASVEGKIEKGNRKKFFEIFKRGFYEIYDYALKFGIKIEIENPLPHIYWGKMEDFIYLIEKLNCEVSFDTSHAFLSGNIIKFLNSLIDYIRSFHISDNRGNEDEHLFPGLGYINWSNFFDELKDNKRYVFILEALRGFSEEDYKERFDKFFDKYYYKKYEDNKR